MITNSSQNTSRPHQEKLPLVTIGIPTYNRSRGLLRTVTSLEKQDYPNLEILISDNGSTDDTPEVCRQLKEKYPNVTVIRQSINRGMTFNFQFVLSAAKGDFFMWHSDDDYLEPNILTRYVDFLVHHPDFVLVSGNVNFWNKDRLELTERDFNFTSENPYDRILEFYKKILHTGIYHGLMRREIAAAVKMKNVMATDWYFLAALLSFGKARNLDIPGYNKHFGGTSDTFEGYAQAIGSGKFSAYNPLLYMAWHAAVDILQRKTVLQDQPAYKKVFLAVRIFFCIFHRFYTKKLLENPIHFLRSFAGSMAKTILPSRATVFIKKRLNKVQKSQCYP